LKARRLYLESKGTLRRVSKEGKRQKGRGRRNVRDRKGIVPVIKGESKRVYGDSSVECGELEPGPLKGK